MANVLDLTILPAKVTITNISKDVENLHADITSDVSAVKHEEGSTKPGALDAQEVLRLTSIPATDTELQMFGKNLFTTLKPGDSVIIKVETSKELLYWNLLKEKFAGLFSVEIAEAE